MDKLSWRPLAATLSNLTEDEVLQLLNDEINIHKRSAHARRLHQRYTMLRAARERADIMRDMKK